MKSILILKWNQEISVLESGETDLKWDTLTANLIWNLNSFVIEIY